MGNNLLTIILPTYNRKALFIRAFESCHRQTCRDFDLLIIDNCSIDGTQDYLLSLANDPLVTHLILNDSNIGPRNSGLKALASAQTEWVTILCDDDYLDEHFVEYTLETLRTTNRDFVAVGFTLCDEGGKVLYTFRPAKTSLAPRKALLSFLRAEVQTAGISGFAFRSHLAPEVLSRDYPHGYLADTMLCVQTIATTGLETVDRVLYHRLIWDKSESAFSIQNIKSFFEALLIFSRDLDALLVAGDFDLQTRRALTKPLPLRRFFYIEILPILARGFIGWYDIRDMFAIARKYDRRYLPHCVLFAVASLVINRLTLRPRRSMHRMYRRLAGRSVATY